MKSENIENNTVYVVIAEKEREGYVFGIYPSLEKAKSAEEYIFSWESPFREDNIFIDKYFAYFR